MLFPRVALQMQSCFLKEKVLLCKRIFMLRILSRMMVLFSFWPQINYQHQRPKAMTRCSNAMYGSRYAVVFHFVEWIILMVLLKSFPTLRLSWQLPWTCCVFILSFALHLSSLMRSQFLILATKALYKKMNGTRSRQPPNKSFSKVNWISWKNRVSWQQKYFRKKRLLQTRIRSFLTIKKM